MKKIVGVSTALVAFGFAAILSAGAQARLKGRVTDSAGKGIEGVAVTVTTPALRNAGTGW